MQMFQCGPRPIVIRACRLEQGQHPTSALQRPPAQCCVIDPLSQQLNRLVEISPKPLRHRSSFAGGAAAVETGEGLGAAAHAQVTVDAVQAAGASDGTDLAALTIAG